MSIRRFEDIKAWMMARELTDLVYQLTSKDPFSRDFGLRKQIQNAAGSVMHNIAEGFDAESNAEFIRFLRYSKRSCSEVQSQLYVAIDQGYISAEDFKTVYDQAGQTRATIRGFINYLISYNKSSKTSKESATTTVN